MLYLVIEEFTRVPCWELKVRETLLSGTEEAGHSPVEGVREEALDFDETTCGCMDFHNVLHHDARSKDPSHGGEMVNDPG